MLTFSIEKIRSIFPLLRDLQGYTSRALGFDFLAGLTVAVILIPQAIAYAQLAGMPAVYGLYAGVVPLFIYGLLGSSRQLSIGPVAVSSILIFAGVSLVAEPFSDRYIQLVILLGLCVGIVQWVMGVLRLGFLVNLLSLPVLSGFISAAAVIIIVSQLPTAIGVLTDKSNNTFVNIYNLFQELRNAQLIPFLISFVGLILILIMNRLAKKFPLAIVLVIISALVVFYGGLDQGGVRIIGEVKGGLPSIVLPTLSLAEITILIPAILTVSLMGCVECLSIAKDLDLKHEEYKIDGNQELKAIGISKMLGSLFQALPSSASFSRSAINDDSGASTGLASIFAAALVAISILFFTHLFYFIPHAILAAIIIGSVLKLINYKYATRLWRISKGDFAMMMVTFFATLIAGVEIGVLTGVALSFGFVLYKSSRPSVFELGQVGDTDSYRNIERFVKAKVYQEYQIIRFDSRLYFANADYFTETILSHFASRKEKPSYLILDVGNITSIDITGLKGLEALHDHLEGVDVRLLIVGAIGVLRDFFVQSEFYNKSNPKHHFMTMNDAVDFIKDGKDHEWHQGAVQSNV